MIELLQASAYGSFLEHVEGGIDASTHRALIAFNAQATLTEVHAKIYWKGRTPRGLVNEVIGHILATAAGLPVAPRAAVLLCSTATLALHYPDTDWSHAGDTYPLWCVETIQGTSPAQLYRAGGLDVIHKDLMRWPEAAGALAFDTWVANVDRHLGNLIRTGKSRYALIDHGRVCTGPAWDHSSLDPDGDFANPLAELLWSRSPLPVGHHVDVCLACDSFAAALAACTIPLDGWLTQLLETDEQASVEAFLHARAGSVGGKMRTAFGMLSL